MPKENKKTCWSVVRNTLSFLSSREFILGYLCISAMLPKVSADNEAVYFTNGMKKSHEEPSDLCIHSTPGCLLGANGLFKNGKRTGYEVSQLCSKDTDFKQHIDTWPLEEQIIHDRYYGTKICDGALENINQASYPLHNANVANSDYRVDFSEADRITVKLKPR